MAAAGASTAGLSTLVRSRKRELRGPRYPAAAMRLGASEREQLSASPEALRGRGIRYRCADASFGDRPRHRR